MTKIVDTVRGGEVDAAERDIRHAQIEAVDDILRDAIDVALQQDVPPVVIAASGGRVMGAFVGHLLDTDPPRDDDDFRVVLAGLDRAIHQGSLGTSARRVRAARAGAHPLSPRTRRRGVGDRAARNRGRSAGAPLEAQ